MPTVLAVPMRMTWTIRPASSDSDLQSISSVSFQRLKDLGPRLESERRAAAAEETLHQLIRFNLLNLGEEMITVTAIELASVRGETLHCDLIAPVNLTSGARYPMMLEVTRGPVTEAVQVEIDEGGRREWVAAQSLPRK